MKMRRSIFLVFVIFLVFSVVVSADKAENYNDVEYLKMSLSINSDVYVKYVGDNPRLDYIKSDLSFFPKDSSRQSVISLDPYSTYSADIHEGENEIVYTWKGFPEEEINYGYDAVVKVENDISRIENEIKFPLAKIEADNMQYTKATEFIDITSGIEKRANEIIGTEDDLYNAVFKLAEWTHTNVEYNLDTLTAEVVQPSSWVLKNKEGVCDEITNLFISLLRSVNIPARFVSGMVYSNTNYEWGAHGWAEVYFPGNGWVPFDVTFGEYGWLDPSHVKLKHDIDSGTPTAKYSWKANGVDVQVSEIKIETDVINVGPKEFDMTEVEVLPVRKTAKFGSYVPIEVKVKNLKITYVAPKIVITKAPELTEENVKRVLLGPKEEKSIFWIIKIPVSDASYIYTTTFEAKSVFGNVDSDIIKYGDEFEIYTKEYAESVVNSHRERETKERLIDVTIDCESDKDLYYGGDEAEIICELQNYASGLISLDICFQENCRKVSVNAGEKKIEKEVLEVAESFRVPIIVESENKISYAYVGLDVIPVPEISISDPEPNKVSYKEEVEINFDVSSNTYVKELVLEFDFGELSYEEFKEGELRTITLHTVGKQLMNDLRFDIRYKDELGKEYWEKRALQVIVTDVPWYGKFFNWVRNLF